MVAGRGGAAWFPWPTWDWSEAPARVARDQDGGCSRLPLGSQQAAGLLLPTQDLFLII